MPTPTPTDHEREFNPIAGVLAWLWPGLGHISLGHRKRGFLIMFGVLFLFLGGVFIGGVDCVDRKSDTLWFLAQGVCGPVAFAVDLVNPHMPYYLSPPADWRKQYSPADRKIVEELGDWQQRSSMGDPVIVAKLRMVGLNKPNEMGTLFCALAGLMNLVVILDALYFAPKPLPDRRST